MKKILYLIIVVVSLVTLSGCKKEGSLIREGYLVVATSPDYAPYEFINSKSTDDNNLLGSDIELMKHIADELGLTLVIEQMSFDACLMAVQMRKADLAISGFTWTPKRANAYEMSTGYYGEGDGLQQVLILSENSDKYKSLSDINKQTVKIAAQSGSIQEEFVDYQIPNATKELVSDLDTGMALLLSKTIDGIAMSEHVAAVRIANNKNLTILEQNFEVESNGFVAVGKKGNTELMNKVNEIIKGVNDKGLYMVWLEEAKRKAIELGEAINE